MSREDGEFELILGNKQLLSVLFIIIVLLGVFFAMGFLAGRSTTSSLAGVTKPTPGAPLVVEPESKSPTTPDAAKGLAPGEVATGVPRELPESKAAAKEPVKEPVKEVVRETAKAEPPKPEPPKPAPAKAAPPKSAGGGGFVETPPTGTYIQIAATRRPDAETLISQLAREGMTGYITPSPKSPELMRVIVGPLGESKDVAETRERLKKLGIENGIVVKYK